MTSRGSGSLAPLESLRRDRCRTRSGRSKKDSGTIKGGTVKTDNTGLSKERRVIPDGGRVFVTRPGTPIRPLSTHTPPQVVPSGPVRPRSLPTDSSRLPLSTQEVFLPTPSPYRHPSVSPLSLRVLHPHRQHYHRSPVWRTFSGVTGRGIGSLGH